MDHAQARGLASRSLDTAIGQEGERDLALHLVTCPGCKSFYDTLSTARTALGELETSPDPHTIDASALRATTVLRGDADPGPSAPMPAPVAVAEETDPTGLSLIDVAAGPDGEATAAAATESPDEPVVDGAQPARAAAEPLEDLPPQRVSRRERRARRREERGRPRRGAWVLAVLAALALAGAAAFVFTQSPRVRERIKPTLPTGAEVKRNAAGAFDELESLEASFRIERLGLYRFRQEDRRVVYSFSNGVQRGRIAFEAPERLREEVSFSVQKGPVTKTTTVRTGDEVRVLTEDESERSLDTIANVPYGPPDGPLLAPLGVLEQAVGSAAHLLGAAQDVKVLERLVHERRDVYRVRFGVPPDTFTRADRIEMLVDAKTWFPIRVERSIGRVDAVVLGPEDLLKQEALDAAFAGRERIVTERVDLENVAVNDVVLPGELVLTAPEGVAAESSDEQWARVSRAELADRLKFKPLFPATVPSGFREQAFAVYTGQPKPWGPRDSLPAPDGIMEGVYTDGRVTVVLSERKLPRRFQSTVSPLSGAGLPVQTRKVVRGGREFTYGISPEVPPHVYGQIGDVFILVTGYAPEEVLIRLAASAATTTVSSPGATTNASPTARPTTTPE